MALKAKWFYPSVVTGLILLVSFSSVPTNANASSGGWTEGIGNYVNEEFGRAAASAPQDHYAKMKYKNHSTYQDVNLTGYTEWKDKKHYTNARVYSLGKIQKEAGRVWGTDKTQASTGYTNNDLTTKKTYWGS